MENNSQLELIHFILGPKKPTESSLDFLMILQKIQFQETFFTSIPELWNHYIVGKKTNVEFIISVSARYNEITSL